MIKVIDDFANIQEQLEIFNFLQQNENENAIYMFYNTSISEKISITSNTIDYPQFVLSVFEENKIYNNILFLYLYKLLHKNKLSNNFIERIKVNITFPYPKNNKKKHGPIHIDSKKGISIIYYVNNSDGDTLFFDEKLNVKKTISPRQGRAVVFDSNIKHTACCPINSKYRKVINFVLYN